MTIDLKGWWAVEDECEATIVRECVGTMLVENGRPAVLVRNPADRECVWSYYPTSFSWFAPEDRAAAEAHAAKIIADYNAPDPTDDEDDGETEEAA